MTPYLLLSQPITNLLCNRCRSVLPLSRRYINADDVFFYSLKKLAVYLQRPQTPFRAIFCQKRKEEKISNFLTKTVEKC